jgi:tetratricopeptide (TPR) repeat protein
MADKKFKVALSFPGEHREFIQQVADHLAHEYGRLHILYDKYHDADFAKPSLGIELPMLYKEQSELVVYFLCKDYAEKQWTTLEWRAIQEMILEKRYDDLMQFKFDTYPVPGDLKIDGYIEIYKDKDNQNLTPQQVGYKILERVRNNETKKQQLNSLDSTTGMTMLQNIESRLAQLAEGIIGTETMKQIQTLSDEKETLRRLLLQKDEIIAQQEKTKQELKDSLGTVQEKEELKKKALEAVEAKDYDEAEKLLMKSAEERMIKVAEDFYQLGSIKELKLEYADALKYYELAAKIPSYKTEYLYKAGQLCRIYGFIDRAMEYHEQLLAICIEQYGRNHKKTAIAFNQIGLLWRHIGDFGKAISNYEQALEINTILGDESIETADIIGNLGVAWAIIGEFDKATKFLGESIDVKRNLLGEETINIAIGYDNLGSTWWRNGNLEKAIEYMEKASNIFEKKYPEASFHLAINYDNLGCLWQSKRDLNRSIEYHEKAAHILLKLFGAESQDIARCYNNIGRAWHSHGDLAKAIEFGQKSYAIFLKLYDHDNPSTKNAKKNLDGYIAERG